MLIICNKNPKDAVDYLIDNTNKNFCFKQLLELGQLICSCGISFIFKPINRGKEIQRWILENPHYVYTYFLCLLLWCMEYINLEQKTVEKFNKIISDLSIYINKYSLLPTNIYERFNNIFVKTAIFRYKQGYECEYPTNSELPIDVAVEEYKKYIKWKFSV